MKFEQPARRVNEFTAAFESECENCGDTIFEGNLAGFVGDLEEPWCGVCLEGVTE